MESEPEDSRGLTPATEATHDQGHGVAQSVIRETCYPGTTSTPTPAPTAGTPEETAR